ncbi:MAG: hypothetical protein A9Z00_10470 [Thermobacillus sp. ZCTH02-B1]|nr:MAG: hypothetical protein A9Z00_10470 [Thermobacillus sp. ZCTH02-B1]
MMGAFRGFTERTIQFLRDLRENNAKEWFERNRPVYERELLEPMRDLVADLSGVMLTIDPEFETRPAVGKTISRIHRDTRFSRDKSPFRDAMWITFKRRAGEWTDAPAFFFELRTDGYRYGMGFYSASKDTMDKLREWIDEEPDDFRRVTAFYGRQKTFAIEGECYKRVLDPDKPASVLEWYQRKNIYLACNREIDELLFSPKLADELAAGFTMLGDLYHAFWKLRMRAG